MAHFTLLELHLDEAQVTANAPFSGEESSKDSGKSIRERVSPKSEAEATDSSSAASPVGILLGVVALVGVAAVVRHFLSSDGSSLDVIDSEEPLLAD